MAHTTHKNERRERTPNSQPTRRDLRKLRDLKRQGL